MAISATLFEALPAERRNAKRRQIESDSTMREVGGAPHTVLVHDLSSDGLRLETPLELTPGMDISIGLPGVGTRVARVVRRDGGFYGCRFVTPVPAALLPQAFGASSVVEAPFPRAMPAFIPEPHVQKWHPAVRVGLLLGSATAMWATILHFATS